MTQHFSLSICFPPTRGHERGGLGAGEWTRGRVPAATGNGGAEWKEGGGGGDSRPRGKGTRRGSPGQPGYSSLANPTSL
jgi:hypothetical protein